MTSKDMINICGVTKKALEYYEQQGLITPKVLPNGYRDYDDADVKRVKEIAVLRKCGIGVGQILSILQSGDKKGALNQCAYALALQREKQERQRERLSALIAHYDIEAQHERLIKDEELLLTIRERLLFSFPGNYGLYLSLHFGRFLNGYVDTKEKRAAYDAVVAYLDGVEDFIPPELGEMLERTLQGLSVSELEKMESTYSTLIEQSFDNFELYLEQTRETTEEYLTLRLSEEYQETEAFAMQQMLLRFQKSSGYAEVFIKNLKILSPQYREYTEKLEEVSRKLLLHYPEAEALYPPTEGEGGEEPRD